MEYVPNEIAIVPNTEVPQEPQKHVSDLEIINTFVAQVNKQQGDEHEKNRFFTSFVEAMINLLFYWHE